MSETNYNRFKAKLEELYTDAFKNDPEYRFSAERTTPKKLAEVMTEGLLKNTANKDGSCIKAACKFFGIKQTYKAIGAFLSDETLQPVANQ